MDGIKGGSMQGFKDSQYLPTLAKVPVSQKQGEKKELSKDCFLRCHLSASEAWNALTEPTSFSFCLQFPKREREWACREQTHSSHPEEISAFPVLFSSPVSWLFLPHLAHIIASPLASTYYCLPSNCPPVPLSYLVNLCLGIRVNLVFSVNLQRLNLESHTSGKNTPDFLENCLTLNFTPLLLNPSIFYRKKNCNCIQNL